MVRHRLVNAVESGLALAMGLALMDGCGSPSGPDPFALAFDFTISGETHMPTAPPEYEAVGAAGTVRITGEVASTRCYKQQEKTARLKDGVITFAIRFEGTKSGDCPTVVDVTPYVVVIRGIPGGAYTVRVEHYGAIDSYFDGATGVWIDLEDGRRLEADVNV